MAVCGAGESGVGEVVDEGVVDRAGVTDGCRNAHNQHTVHKQFG